MYIYLRLFFMFLKVGLFTIGGGYAMIPLIQEEIAAGGWMDMDELTDIIAVSEMTPGPFAINAATFVGIEAAGIPGAIFANLGAVFPSIVIVMLVARYFEKFKEHQIVKSILHGIRPAVVGLIASAAFVIGKSVFIEPVIDGVEGLLARIDFIGIILFIIAYGGAKRFKIHPVWMIIIAGILGAFLY